MLDDTGERLQHDRTWVSDHHSYVVMYKEDYQDGKYDKFDEQLTTRHMSVSPSSMLRWPYTYHTIPHEITT
jgi:hypothetical protein